MLFTINIIISDRLPKTIETGAFIDLPGNCNLQYFNSNVH